MNTNWDKYVEQTTPGRPQRDWKPLALRAHQQGTVQAYYRADAIRRRLGVTWDRMNELSEQDVLPMTRRCGVKVIMDVHVYRYFDPDEFEHPTQ